MIRCMALLCVFFVAAPCWAARAVVDWEYEYVNVRRESGGQAEKVGRLTRGAEAEVLGDNGEWTRIRYPGGEGWVVTRSLRPVADPPPHTVAAVVETPAAGPSPASSGVDEAPPAPAPAVSEPTGVPEKASDGYLSRYLDRPEPPVPDAGGGLVNLLSGLLIVLALIAGGVWAGRRLLGRRFPPRTRGSGIRVLTTRPLGPKQALLLVEAGGLVWLVSQGVDGVNLVAEIREPGALDRLNETFGFRDSPFEAELRRRVDLESREIERPGEPTPEDRLAALRRRPGSGEES